jgi:hypothetical protein
MYHLICNRSFVTFQQTIRIFDDRVAVALDCGDEVGEWLDSFLEKGGLRLVYHFSDKTQRNMTSLQKKFPMFSPADKVFETGNQSFHDRP